MFIIFGMGSRKNTIATGQFNCPRCDQNRPFKHVKATRYFTLFFIPLIPLNELGDYVECGFCKDTYYPRVLEQKSRAQIADIATIGIRHVATAMLHADGFVDVREKIAALSIVARYSTAPYTLDDLENDLDTLDRGSLTDNLEELGAILNDHGKDSIVSAAVLLAWSDGHAHESEIEVIREIGKAMTMRKSHVDDLISTMLAELQANHAVDAATPTELA